MVELKVCCKNKLSGPWLDGSDGWSIISYTGGLRVRFLVRACTPRLGVGHISVDVSFLY